MNYLLKTFIKFAIMSNVFDTNDDIPEPAIVDIPLSQRHKIDEMVVDMPTSQHYRKTPVSEFGLKVPTLQIPRCYHGWVGRKAGLSERTHRMRSSNPLRLYRAIIV
jgi:hypothetical protein